MTISGARPRFARLAEAAGWALVIIATGIAGLPGTAFAAAPALTTEAPAALTAVVVDGSTVYSAPQLFAAYRDQLGLAASGETARSIAGALADMYVRDGYLKPEFTLDDALTARGVLRLQVYEAQVTHVIYEGAGERFHDTLGAIGSRLENSRPLRKDDVQQALRAMRQIAGLSVTATTRRDPDIRNAFELLVQADYSPVDGVVRMNNRGTDQVGPAFLLGQLFANGLFGGQEKVGLIYAAATDHDEYLGGGLYIDTALGSAGTRGNALLFRSHSAPNEEPVNLDDEYTRERLTFRLTKPFRQQPDLSLSGSLGFEADDLLIDRAGEIVRDDRLRIVEGMLRTNWLAGATQLSANLQLRHGLDGLGSRLDARDLAADPRRADFIVTLAQGTVYRRFASRWSLRLDMFSQISGYVLPDSERFKIGGDRLGRGFEVAEIAGDSGIGGKLELRRDLMNTDTFIGRLSAYGFYDIGATWKQDLPGRESAATAGTGFALQGAALTGYLEVAAPLTGTDIEGKQRASVFAELSYRF
ncbi:MAG TPA: ShlB/FhaC/HecB family hemolysin secretion/activation protein [Steroidobacteraceae bacterium]|nr:ShlB/FhaC/HecB family hemolysin secretion/activation protein [Steroidobacteraceae bacterium]